VRLPLLFATILVTGLCYSLAGLPAAVNANGNATPEIAGAKASRDQATALAEQPPELGVRFAFHPLYRTRSGPSVVIVNAGMAKSLTTAMLRKRVYAFAFGQKRFNGDPWVTRIQDHADHTRLRRGGL
jgi:hypothetical protein